MAATLEGYTVLEHLFADGIVEVLRVESHGPDPRRAIAKRPHARHDDQSVIALRRDHELVGRYRLDCMLTPVAITGSGRQTLTLYDDRPGPLLSSLGTLSMDERLARARQLAQALASVHDAGLIHQDLRPNNILCHDNAVTILDFSRATLREREQRDFLPLDPYAARVRFMAPEQSGRMNQDVDARADLYSLGAILYWLFTGAAPFDSSDLHALIYQHLAIEPTTPSDRNPEIPAFLDDILLHLLTKDPRYRYQSAHGLITDLDTLERILNGEIRNASLVTSGRPAQSRLDTPRRLYGRDHERQALLECFDQACEGTPSLMILGGHSGIGKTALIRETYIPVTRQDAFFVSGKFEQFQGATPYSGWLQALGNLLDYVLAETGERMEAWRQRVGERVGGNAAALAPFLPQLETLLGPQPAPPELPPLEARERFHESFRQLVETFSSSPQPLVVFLDDLQWADPASLRLIEALYRHADPAHLLLILAYRDNEVSDSHPLMLMLNRLPAESAFRCHWKSLGPLEREDLEAMIADALHLGREDVTTLAGEIHRKTAGNPFFVWQLLNSLRDNHWLWFDTRAQRWRWRLQALRNIEFADHVVDLMLHRFQALSEDTHRLLSLAACLGTHFDLATLAELTGDSLQSIWNKLQPALNQEFILPAGGVALVQDQPVTESMRFMHDRMQEAAYHALDESEVPRLHLAIARLLIRENPPTRDSTMLLTIAGQLNAAAHIMTDPGEQDQLVRINLWAAQRAKTSAAFGAALGYLHTGMAHLDETLWQTDPELAFELHRERGELEYLNGDFASARRWVTAAIDHETDHHRQAELYRMLVTQHTLMAEYDQAIRIGTEGLALFGVSLPERDYESARDQELDRVARLLDGRPLAALADLPWMSDGEQIAIMRLLITMGPPCYRYHPRLWSVIVAHEIRMCLEHGTLPVAAYSFPAYGGLLIHTGRGTGDDCRVLYEATQALITRCEQAADRSVGHLMMGSSLRHWFSPLTGASEDYLNAYESGLESGNLQYAVYGFGHNTYCRFFQGTGLDTLIPEVRGYLAFTTRRGNQWGIDLIEGSLRVFLALRGDAPTDPEATYLDRCAEHGNRQVLCIYHILCSEAAALMGHWREAAAQLDQAQPLIDTVSVQGLLPVTRYHGLRALVAAQDPDGHDNNRIRTLLREARDRFAGWARHAPANFGHWQWLMDAELARLDGDVITAMSHYDHALEQVRGQHLPNAVALVARLAAGLWERQEKSDFADLYWGHFQRAAQQWQAYALLDTTPHRQSAGPGQASTDVDLPAVIRIAEALSLHTNLAELVPEITRNVARQTGAQRVALLLERHGSLVLAMDSHTERSAFFHEPPELEDREDLPRSVLRYVARTHESFRFSRQDIENSLLLRSDPYFRSTIRNRPARVGTDAATVEAGWCIPLMVLGECVGLLYMEHRLISNAFDDTREPLIEFLAAQGAISIRTVELINRLAEEARARREAELRIQNADAEISMRKEHERNLRQLATTDFLTGLPNRRTLMERLEEEWNRQQRHSPTPAVLLMLDVDHFKQINDRFGHAAGDQVLCDLADLFRHELRNFDLPARLGGEEFAMLIQDVDREQAASIAERLRLRVSETPSLTSDDEIPFTVSIGVAEFDPDDRSHEAVLQRADKALYQAKSQGRNRVCLAPPGQ